MKVRIEDKEALDALSWESLRAYLDQAGWRHADDFPGKAAIYQVTAHLRPPGAARSRCEPRFC
jgi:hypothetical protein